ncbi:MAG: hypothetical protein A3E80_01115 [Chlamydiae bacterium RIFCSPHIGHO2_12_FULL_49_9]|nr:MAG: hypothetical protein A3E80_01115 [Chlamydiae bacterium RIFCSPHIGHO2_12_FULL_49_9]
MMGSIIAQSQAPMQFEKETLRPAAFNTGPDFHLLDHIAPLADLMQMPLITTEEKNFELAQTHYPQIQTILEPDLEFKLGAISEKFDILFECKYWPAHLKQLFFDLYKKKMRLVFCPHGQSDKGFEAPLLAPYSQQDVVLLYGDLLIDMLKELSLWPYISNYVLIGNYRLQFYRKYQSFQDALAEKKVFAFLDSKKPTLLYAPTWKDADQSTSFFEYGPAIFSHLPEDWNLIVKVHPLLEQRDPAHFYSVAALVDKKPGAILVSDFPFIYPLIARSSAYLGDFSSVGYDCLALNRPLFFLPTPRPGRLHSCGTILNPRNDFHLLFEPNIYQEKQKTLSMLAFGPARPAAIIREEILKTCSNRN